jgi:putative spermidine/putrescine transport system substrate-binding protein
MVPPCQDDGETAMTSMKPAAALLTAGVTAGAALAALGVGPAAAQDSITFSSWGGAFQEAQRKAFLDPAEEELGITINEDSHTGLATIKTQVLSGNVYWDLVDLSTTDCQRGAQQDLWLELDYGRIPNAKDLDDEFKAPTWVGQITYSTVLGWNESTVGDKAPQNWAEFFDTEAFPGKRTMRNNARESLEIALLADGVSIDELYPLDVDRAYSKLEEIKPHVSTWWTSGAQSAQLLADGSVDYAALWNGRVQAAIDEGAEADYHWNEALLQVECLVVPKGAPNPEAAMKVINVVLDPENQARLATLIPYGPINPKAYETGILSEERAMELPTAPDHLEGSLVVSPQFWTSPEGEKALERWARFTQQ